MEIFLNGVLQVSDFTHSTTINLSLTAARLHLGNDLQSPGTNQSGIDIYWDDIAFATGAYIGAGGSIAVQGKAGAPAHDAFTKNGDTTAAACWSQTPFDTAKNCSTTAVHDQQTMLVDDAALGSLVPAGATINGAFVGCVGIASAVSAHCHRMRRLSGVDTIGGTTSVTTSKLFLPNGVNADPMEIFTDTLANLQALEIGIEGHPASGSETFDDVWLFVDYAPAPGTNITPSTGAMAVTGQTPNITDTTHPRIFPGTGSLGLVGYEPGSNRKTPAVASLALAGQQARVYTREGLKVTFQVWDPVLTPLVVKFTVQPGAGMTPTPLQVSFRVVAPLATPLVVTFRVFPAALVDRESGVAVVAGKKRSGDVQGPVAEVNLTGTRP